MFRQEVLESGKSVRCDVKRGHFDVREKSVEFFRLKNDLGEWFVTDALPQHCAAV